MVPLGYVNSRGARAANARYTSTSTLTFNPFMWNCACIYRSSGTEEMDVLISKLLFPGLHAKASVLILIFLMLVIVLCRRACTAVLLKTT